MKKVIILILVVGILILGFFYYKHTVKVTDIGVYTSNHTYSKPTDLQLVLTGQILSQEGFFPSGKFSGYLLTVRTLEGIEYPVSVKSTAKVYPKEYACSGTGCLTFRTRGFVLIDPYVDPSHKLDCKNSTNKRIEDYCNRQKKGRVYQFYGKYVSDTNMPQADSISMAEANDIVEINP